MESVLLGQPYHDGVLKGHTASSIFAWLMGQLFEKLPVIRKTRDSTSMK